METNDESEVRVATQNRERRLLHLKHSDMNSSLVWADAYEQNGQGLAQLGHHSFVKLIFLGGGGGTRQFVAMATV